MKFWMLFLVVILSVSCQEVEKVEAPQNLIPEKKMVEVLTDLSLITSAKNFNRRMLEQTGFRPEEFLYEKHNIDSLSLAESTKFYAQDPAILERIYSRVQRNLESLRADLDVIRKEEIRELDSINAANGVEDSLSNDSLILDREDSLIQVTEPPADTLIRVPEIRRNRIQD